MKAFQAPTALLRARAPRPGLAPPRRAPPPAELKKREGGGPDHGPGAIWTGTWDFRTPGTFQGWGSPRRPSKASVPGVRQWGQTQDKVAGGLGTGGRQDARSQRSQPSHPPPPSTPPPTVSCFPPSSCCRDDLICFLVYGLNVCLPPQKLGSPEAETRSISSATLPQGITQHILNE